jgi:hypothetical protein
MVWFPLHAPEKAGTEGVSFYLSNIFICNLATFFYSVLAFYIPLHPTVNHPWWAEPQQKP